MPSKSSLNTDSPDQKKSSRRNDCATLKQLNTLKLNILTLKYLLNCEGVNVFSQDEPELFFYYKAKKTFLPFD